MGLVLSSPEQNNELVEQSPLCNKLHNLVKEHNTYAKNYYKQDDEKICQDIVDEVKHMIDDETELIKCATKGYRQMSYSPKIEAELFYFHRRNYKILRDAVNILDGYKGIKFSYFGGLADDNFMIIRWI